MSNAVTDRLRQGSKKIMNLWELRAQKEIAAADGQDSLALRNSLPEYLNQMVDALSSTIDRTPKRVREDKNESTRVGKKHGHERGSFSTYSIDQLIFEYHILREVIFHVLEEKEDLPREARDIIIDSIEQAVNDAATQFSATLKEFQEEVATTIIHDLRTPITAAKISAELILRKPEDAESCVKYAKRIVENTKRVDLMVQDLLNSSRVQAGKDLELTFGDLDFGHMTTQVCEDLNMIHGNRTKVEISPPIVGYWSEQGLRRILENLILNAIKYGKADSSITIKLSSKGNMISLSVHNEGKPIAAGEIESLFKRFSRGRDASDKDGWGIGLSLVKGIVEAHKGKVWAESSEEAGTLFFVELPTDYRQLEKFGNLEKIEKIESPKKVKDQTDLDRV